MRQKTFDGYQDAPKSIESAIANSVDIADFLPSPSELRRQERKKKITISLDSSILNFFKDISKKH
jgi:hypothetical protein